MGKSQQRSRPQPDQEPDSFNQDFIEGEFEQKSGGGGGSRSLVPTYDVPIVRADYYVRKPVTVERSLVRVEKALMQEATMAGEEFYYSWGEGKDRVEGGSVQLAMAMARCWGNCVVEQLPMQETRDAYIFTARFIDLETGFTYDRQLRQSKRWTVHGKFDEARKEDIRYGIGQSKAARNVILRSLPEYMKNKAIEQAKNGVRQRLEEFIERQAKQFGNDPDAKKKGLAAAQNIVIESLIKEGVPEPRVLSKYEIEKRTALDVDKLVELRGMLRAIQVGEENADDLFPPTDAEIAEKAAKQAEKESATQQGRDQLDQFVAEIQQGAGKPTGSATEPLPTPSQTPTGEPQQQRTETAPAPDGSKAEPATGEPSAEDLQKQIEAKRQEQAQQTAAADETIGPDAAEFIKRIQAATSLGGVKRVTREGTENYKFSEFERAEFKRVGDARYAEIQAAIAAQQGEGG